MAGRLGPLSLALASVMLAVACGGKASDTPTDTTNQPDSFGFNDLVDNEVSLPDARTDLGSRDEGPPPPDVGSEPGCSLDLDCAQLEVEVCFEPFCDTATSECRSRPRSDQPECDDGDLCTDDDRCNAGACVGSARQCSDDNPCTQDSCDPGQGCVFAPVEGGCNDGDLCTTADRCVDGTCVGDANPSCQCTVDSDCAQFEDGNACNGTLICTAKQCLVDESTIVTCPATSKPCLVSSCDPLSGACVEVPAEDGLSCNDDDACTDSDQCQLGLCLGQAVVCDDANPCTDDGCNSASGCIFANNTNSCDDGDLCTSGDQCSAGACLGTPDPACNCTETADCQAFEDGNLCNGTLVCNDGVCLPDPTTIVSCAPSENPCINNVCEPTMGLCSENPVLEGSACDDANACTQNDTCSSGVCTGVPTPCNDGNACTDDSCDTATGCVFNPNSDSCDDGEPCTTGDACLQGACVGAPDPTCTCSSDDDCEDDGDLCNGTSSCVGGQCTVDPATVVSCTSTNPCKSATCIPETGACVIDDLVNGTPCDDNNACTTEDLCVAGACSGTPLSCDDQNPCTNDTCSQTIGCTSTFNSAPCDDGNDCTLGDICVQGSCSGTPDASCVCNSTADCLTFEDGDACNGTLICVANKCVVDPSTVVTCDISANGECRTNTCDPADGTCDVVNAQNGKPCSDGNACTESDACSGGTCVGAATVACNDGNTCTDDSCNASVGCVFVDNTASCDDGDPCTDGDSCLAGTCQPGANTCPGACEPAYTLTCGGSDTWNNGSFGSTSLVDTYPCNTYTYPAPEYTYTFTAPYNGEFTVQLSDEAAITDVMLLKSDGDGCDPTDCVDSGFATATQTMKAGEIWHVVVDGWYSVDETGAFTIGLSCSAATESSCTDGLDNDGDEAFDCFDSDCTGDPACATPTCAAAVPIGCDASDTSSSTATGSTDAEDGYSCNSFDYAGPEYTYSFWTPVPTEVTVSLSNETATTDVLVLEGGNNGCDATTCIGYTLGSGVTFTAKPSTTYYLVVDGYAGAEGSFTLNVACADSSAETNCSDGADNDGDQATDCADTDCLGVGLCPACLGDGDCGSGEVCMAGACAATCAGACSSGTCSGGVCSQSCSSSSDCPQQQQCFHGLCAGPCTADADCIADQFCGAGGVCVAGCTATSDCPSGYQCLGLTCTPECSSVAACASGHSCVGGVCAENCSTATDCIDGLTCDQGLCTVTCSTASDCPSQWSCDTTCQPPATSEDCTNGQDDDGDGLADCQDGDCMESGECPSCGTSGDFFLTCNDSDSWTTANQSADISNYACLPWGTSGKEYVYRFDAPSSGTVTVALSGLAVDVDLDLIVLEQLDGYCNPESCVAYGDSSATFDATQGTRYFVVVDGFLGDEGDFTIDLTCQ